MIPDVDDRTIRLPVTFDYNGGRGDKFKGNILTVIITLVLAIIFIVGICRNVDMTVAGKVIGVAAVVAVVNVFLRFKVLHELTYSDAYETLKELDNQPSSRSLWSIYSIDDEYPYICHYLDGKHGIFVRLEKDVVVGKPDDIAFTHYEAISEAYNLAGSLNMNMCHIDYMDNVGNDPRLKQLYESLNDCDNPDLKELMLSVYANLQSEMSMDYASFDVYVFTSRGNPDQLYYNVKQCVDKLLNGNYLSYKALDSEAIRTTCMAIFNLNEFSAADACANIFKENTYRGIVPIRVEHIDSVEEINRTQEQIRADNLARQQAEMEAKANKHKRKRGQFNESPTQQETEVSESGKEFVDSENAEQLSSDKTGVSQEQIDKSPENRGTSDEDLNLF